MKSLLAFALLLAVTFIGSIGLFRRFGTRSPLAYLTQSGTLFLLFGLVVGGNGLDLIQESILLQLQPLLHFGLGWVGFMYGFQLEWRYLRRIPRNWYLLTGFLFVLPAGILAVGAGSLGRLLPPVLMTTGPIPLAAPLLLGILLAESCTAFVFWSNRHYRLKGRHFRMICLNASLDNLFPIVFAAGLPLALGLSSGPGTLAGGSLQVFLGVAGGWLTHKLVRRLHGALDASTILFGIVFTLSGAAFLFHLSSLFVTMVAGITFTNLTRRHAWFQQRLTPVEKPLYLMFMIALPLFPARLNLVTLVAAMVLVALKYAAKRMVAAMSSFLYQGPRHFAHFAALLFLPMSATGPAILLELRWRIQGAWLFSVTGVFIFAMLISEMIGSAGVFRRGSGEAG